MVMAVVLLMSAAGLGVAEGDHDARRDDAERASRGAETGRFVPLAKIIAMVRERYAGEIVETEFEWGNGRPYYEFYLLQTDGRVIEIKVDAATGHYITTDSDDDD
jgi:uncharacterized membrane protein YkoI